MVLGPRLDLRQSQQLVMTPQLQQAIKLLALSNVELEGFLQGELEKNPLLDRSDAPDSGETGGTDADASERASAAESVGTDELIAAGGSERDAPLDVDYGAETFHHDGVSDQPVRDPDGGYTVGSDYGIGSGGGEDFVDPGEINAAARSLHDFLLEQAGLLIRADQIIASDIIDSIDPAGYFTGSLTEAADRLGVPEARVEAVLLAIQTFEPTGVGARDLAECLVIQAKEADRYDPAMKMMLSRLDLVARGELAALQRLCRVDAEDMADMLAELRGYNPKPGLAYGAAGDAAPIIPDVFISADAEGGWKVELNQATLPRILVNHTYAATLAADGARSKETKAFLSECLSSANWLMNALDQRQRTIVKVATELVKQQDGFFRHGVSKLRPLTLRAVADQIEMHESTVSRVTSNKYLSCERGLFELKYFFTSAIGTAEGEDVSAEAVKSRISALIGAESPKKVLSDDKLVTLLKAEGFDIARRTVAKYRESLNIGSSVQRRRAYKLGAASRAA